MSGCLSWREIEALADGAGDASAREHVAHCARCGRFLAAEMRYREAARTLAGESAPGAPEAVIAAVAAAKPARPVSCRRAHRLLDLYLDDRLPAEALTDFEAHLFTCRSCYVAYRQALDLRDALASLAEAPPEGLLEQVLSSVAAARAVPAPARPRRMATAGALAAAAAAIALLISATLWMRHPSPGLPHPTAPPRVATAPAPSPAPAATPKTPIIRPPQQSRLAAEPRTRRPARASNLPTYRKAGRSTPPEPQIGSAMVAAARPPVPDQPIAAPAVAKGPAGTAISLTPASTVPARTAPLPPAPAPTPPSIAEAPAPSALPAAVPLHPPASAISRPEPTPPPSPPLRLAEATTDVRPRWLPVREAPVEHIGPEPRAVQTPLEAVASRVNERLHEDELASRDGWIPIK